MGKITRKKDKPKAIMTVVNATIYTLKNPSIYGIFN